MSPTVKLGMLIAAVKLVQACEAAIDLIDRKALSGDQGSLLVDVKNTLTLFAISLETSVKDLNREIQSNEN